MVLLKKFYNNFLLKKIPKLASIFKYNFIILKKFYNHSLFFLKVVTLKIKNPKLIMLPSKHIYALNMLLKIKKEFDIKKINFFLLAGTLLGAVRQESFAGRPSDIDFGIKSVDQNKFLNILPNIKKIVLPYKIRVKTKKKIYKIQLIANNIFIDINFFFNEKSSKSRWFNPYELSLKNRKKIFFFNKDLDNLKKTKLYGYDFNSPSNPKIYLKKRYGNDWLVPDKKQFLWKKLKYK